MYQRSPSALFFALVCAGSAVLAPSGLHAQAARLINLSTRGQVGIDANILIGGFSISGGNKTVLVRAIGPALADFGVAGTVADPVLSIINSAGAIVATNDNWQSADASTFSQVGAFPLTAGSKDAVIVANLPPGGYSAQISGLGANKTGVALLEVYDVTGTGQLVNIATRLQVGTGANVAIAGFSINPGSGTRKLLIRGVGPALVGFGVPGTLADPKLTVFDGAAQIIAIAVANGSVSALASATAQAGAFATTAGDAATIVTLNPGSYTVQLSGNNNATTGVGLIEVYDITNSVGTPVALASTAPKLYYASLRPNSAATTSTASGYATILFDPNTNVATISVNFSNLSSSATSAHLVIGTNASSGNFVFNLPRGQANALTWTFPSSGTYSTADLIAALQSGQLFVSIDSAIFPGGELQGGFLITTGSPSFAAPAAAPAILLTNVTATDAARLLMQATFGPKKSEIDALTGGSITAWIDAQMAMPFTSHRVATLADQVAFGGSSSVTNWNAVCPENRQAAWFKNVLTAPDQLRQRVAFALSQILVISDVTLDGDDHTEGVANYYDLLGNAAFGNFRTLLENVTLSPMMGEYLSSLRNAKADSVTGTTPDENYAREIMQLFTIGLNQLQPDGTLKLDAAGLPIPTYNQTTVTEMAKVFTGWGYPSTNLNNFRTARSDFNTQMQLFPAFHEDGAKNLSPVLTAPISANQGGAKDLQLALDALFNHPNTGPFLSRQLIQRLVTSNPSPAYVYRVAQKFENDGSGVRGNLGAVVRAILTDYEARSPLIIGNSGYGKLREPLLRFVALYRTFNATSKMGRFASYRYSANGVSVTASTPNPVDPALVATNRNGPKTAYTNETLAQSAVRSPTVFNFYPPDYSVPGSLATAGLVAPEFQITDDTTAVTVPNALRELILLPSSSTASAIALDATLTLDLSYEQTLAGNPTALVDHLGLVMASGNLPASIRTGLISGVTALPSSYTTLDRARSALLMLATSSACAVQK